LRLERSAGVRFGPWRVRRPWVLGDGRLYGRELQEIDRQNYRTVIASISESTGGSFAVVEEESSPETVRQSTFRPIVVKLSRPATAQSAPVEIRAVRTSAAGIVRHNVRPNPTRKLTTRTPKNSRSRQQRVSTVKAESRMIHTTYVATVHESCGQK